MKIGQGLTDGLDEVGKKDAIHDVRFQVSDPLLAFPFLQIMIPPIRIYLTGKEEDKKKLLMQWKRDEGINIRSRITLPC